MHVISRRSLQLVAYSVAIGATLPAAHAEIHIVAFPLSGDQEVPPTPSPATGDCTVTLDDIARTVSVDCTYNGLIAPAIDAHIHIAPPGVNGPAILTLNHTGGTNGTVTGFGMLLPNDMQAMLDGNTYINVHSAAFPSGEIRGQLNFDADPEPEAFVGGLLHTGLGDATMSVEDLDGDGIPDLLVVGNIGSSGNDGVRVAIADIGVCNSDAGCGNLVRGWSGEIDIGPAGNLPEGMHLEISFDSNQQVVRTINFVATDGDAAAEIAPDCPDCSINIKAWRNGELVADMDRDGALDVVLTGNFGTGVGGDGLPQPMRMSYWRVNPHYTMFDSYVYHVQGEGVLGLGAGLPIEADVILIEIDDPNDPGTAMDVAAVEITAANLAPGGALTIQNEQVLMRGFAIDDALWFLSAAGQAHIVGVEVCDEITNNCIASAIEISNLGSSGEDGVTFGPGANDVEGIPIERDGLAGRKIHFAPLILDLEGDGVSKVKISSEWCMSSDPAPPSCGKTVRLSSWLEIDPKNSGLRLGADFLGVGAITQDGSAEGLQNGVSIGMAAVDWSQGLSIMQCPGGEPVTVAYVIEANHAYGQNVPALIWGFVYPVCVDLPGVGTIVCDELRVRGASDFVIDLVYRRRTSITAGGGPEPGTIYITDIEPAALSFTDGYAFGLHHTATDGAHMTIGCVDCELPPGTGTDKLPLVIGGGGSGGRIAIHAAEPASESGADFIRVELLPLDLHSAGMGLGGAAFAAETAGGDAPLVFTWEFQNNGGIWPGLPIELQVSFEPAGSQLQTISLYNEGVLVAEHIGMPNNTPIGLSNSPKGTHAGEVDYGLQHHFSVEIDGIVSVGGGSPPLDADVVTFTAQDPVITGPISHITLELLGNLDEFIIIDEALGMFDIEHRATGAARIGAMSAPFDEFTKLRVSNPTHGGGASVSGVYSEKVSFGGQTGIGHQHFATAIEVPDPCAGKPEPCEALEDGATLISGATLTLNDGGTGHLDMFLTPTECAVEGLVTHYRGGLIRLLATGFGPHTTTVEVLLEGAVVATVPDFADPVTMCCQDCGHNENWNFDVSHTIINPTINDDDVQSEIAWGSQRIFSFEIPAEGRVEYTGDTLRFITLSVEGVSGVINHSVTSVNIPEVHIIDMEFVEVVPPTPCPADIAPPGGDGQVGVPDLLAVINAWGPCPPPIDCPADIAPPPGGDETVGVPDLLLIINNWGPCP